MTEALYNNHDIILYFDTEDDRAEDMFNVTITYHKPYLLKG